eukprot:XP_014046412.1 PREDICTED: uncharacterized protein LOC106599644 [Salmo salar]
MMASRSTLHFKPPLTIIITYGLKSWLECLCRAILIEGPRQIPEFIAAYCDELLEFRERNPLMDTKDITYLYQEIREANYVEDWKASIDLMHRQQGLQYPPGEPAPVHCDQMLLLLAEETLSVSQRISPRSTQESNVPSSEPMGGPDEQAQSLSSPPGGTHNGDDVGGQSSPTLPGDGAQSSPAQLGDQPSPAVEEEGAQAGPGSAVQSAVFQRSPSGDSLLEANHSAVLISTDSAPTNNTVIVHSENPPETIVFHSDRRLSSGVSSRGSLTWTLSVGEGNKVWVNDPTEVMSDDVVVFHKVPSMDSLSCMPSAWSNTSLAAEEKVDQVISKSSKEFLLENVLSGSPSFGEVASAAALQQEETDQIRSTIELTEKVSSSEIVGARAAWIVSSFGIPCRKESVGRTPETPERHTSPRVYSLLSAHSDESLKGTDKSSISSLTRVPSAPRSERGKELTISPKSSLARLSSASVDERAAESTSREVFSNVEELLVPPTASVGRASALVTAARHSGRALSGRAFSETELVDAAHRVSSVRIPSREESVRRTAETPERHTFSVSPHASSVSECPVMFEKEDWCVITIPSAPVKKAVKFNPFEEISPISSPSIELAWEELLQTSKSIVDKVAFKTLEIVNKQLQCSRREISEMAPSDPVVVSQSLNVLSYDDLSYSPSAVEEFSTASARCSEGDVTEGFSTALARCSEGDVTEGSHSETAVESEAISVREISPAVTARCSASDESERVPSETAVLGAAAPSMEELSESPTALVFEGGISPAVLANDVSERAPSETSVAGAEASERHTSLSVSPQTSFVSAHSEESLKAKDLSPPSSLARIPSVYLSDGVSPAVSARCSASDLLERASSETTKPRVIPSAPSMDELLVLPTVSVVGISTAVSARSSRGSFAERAPSETAVEGVKYSESGLSGRAFSETELVDAAHRVSSVTIPSKEESVRRTAETPERHSSPRVSPQTSSVSATRLSSKSSLSRVPSVSLSDGAAESVSMEVIANVEDIYTAPSVEQIVSSTAAVVGISPAVSARCSSNDMSGRTCFEAAVVGAEIPEKHTSPKVSPQTSLMSAHVGESMRGTDISPKSSLDRISSIGERTAESASREVMYMEEMYKASMAELPGPPAAVGGISQTVSARCSQRDMAERVPSETVVGRDTSSRVSPRVSPHTSVSSVFYRDSSVGELHLSPSVGEELVVEAYELPSLEKKETPSTSVGRLSPVVSARYTGSGLTRRAFSEKEVTRPETPDRHTSPRLSPRVSPQSSLTRISSAPTMEEPWMSPTASVGRLSPAVSSVRYSGRGLSGRPFSETKLVDAAHRVSSVRIPSREESVRRTAETPERHTSPRVFPRSSQRVSPQTSLISAHVGESLSGTDISPQFSLPRIPFAPSMDRPTSPIISHISSQRVSLQSSLSRIPSAPSMEELLVSPSTSVGRMSPAVSRRSSKSSLSERAPSETIIRYSESCLPGRAFSETKLVDAAHRVSSVRIPSREESVRRTAEIHTSPRVSPRMSPRTSPQSSLARIPSAPSMEEPLVSSTASVCRIPPAATVEAAHREESVARTAEAPESHTTHRVSFRIYPQTSKTSVLSDVAVLYSPSMTAGFRLEVLDMESDQVNTSVSDIIAKFPSDTAAMKTIHRESSGRIPSREEIVRRTAETQTSHASGVLDNSTQVSQTAIRLCEEVSAYPIEVQQGTLGLEVYLGASPANVVGPQNNRTQNTRSQGVQTSPDHHGEPSQSVPIGAGRVTPHAQPARENYTNQVWTLYHLANETEEGTLSAKVISQPPYNGSAYIRNFGAGHVLLAERSPSPQKSDTQSWSGQPKQPQPPPFLMSPRRAFTHRAQSSTLPPPSLPQPPTVHNQEISIPNFFMHPQLLPVSPGKIVRSIPTAMQTGSRSAVVRPGDPPGYLSFSVPMETVSGGSGQDGQAQFLQVISAEGNTVYSPALINIFTTEEEDQEGARRRPTSAPFNW